MIRMSVLQVKHRKHQDISVMEAASAGGRIARWAMFSDCMLGLCDDFENKSPPHLIEVLSVVPK